MSSRDDQPGRQDEAKTDSIRTFEDLRPHLMGVAYRILGSVADSEDVLQESWLRWSRIDQNDVVNPEAFLTTVVGRLSLDHLRRVKTRRETYTGSWLPEPIRYEPDPTRDPGAALEFADSLSMALLVVLETLSPLERAAFVLREIFERPYPEVAATLDRSESAVRQLVRRGRERVDVGHARFRADRDAHAGMVDRFLLACQSADLDALLELLAPDVVIVSDAGGQAPAPARPVHGRDKVARLLASISHRVPTGVVFSIEFLNGSLGIVARGGPTVISAMTLTTADGVVQSLQLIANPDKLLFLDSDVNLI